MDHPPRLIPYTRQSLGKLGETRDTSLSLEAQRAVIADYANAQGFIVAEPIQDHDLKGDDPARPGLAELERFVQPGDTVAVYKFDRLARDVVLQESLIRRLQARNVQVISVTEPSTRLTRVIYGAVNEEYRDALSQRIKDAKRQQAMRGHYTGANTPYGYQRSQVRAIPLPDGGEYLRPTGVLTVEQAEAAVVRDIYARVAGGDALFAIAADLNLRGVPTRHKSQWHVTTIKQLVRNRWYYGAATYKGDEIAPGLHEPLIDRDLWERANLLIERPSRRHTDHKGECWLEGYVTHACGRRMYMVAMQRSRDRTQYSDHFLCQSRYFTVKCGLPRAQVSRRKLDAAVRQCLERDLSNVVSVGEAFGRAVMVAGGPETVQRRAALDEKRARVLARYDRVRDAWASGMESLDWLAAEQHKRDDALTEIDADLASLPVVPDLAHYEAVGAQLHALAQSLPLMGDQELTAVLAELGGVRVDESGVWMRYDVGISDFVPVPFVAGIG